MGEDEPRAEGPVEREAGWWWRAPTGLSMVAAAAIVGASLAGGALLAYLFDGPPSGPMPQELTFHWMGEPWLCLPEEPGSTRYVCLPEDVPEPSPMTSPQAPPSGGTSV